jgi:D-glycero-D-manno-heptose 1,7-bisphosphate phosphatase
MNKAVFIDRDGTINEEMGYINHLSRFKIFDNVSKAIRLLNKAKFKIVIITNQSGVGQGYFNEEFLIKIHEHLILDMKNTGAHIDKIYYCPHHPDAGNSKYKLDCNCRKPKAGLIELAQAELGIDLSRSFIIGDSHVDVKLAQNAKLKSVLVLTGYGKGLFAYHKTELLNQPDLTFQDMYEAAQFMSDHYRD